MSEDQCAQNMRTLAMNQELRELRAENEALKRENKRATEAVDGWMHACREANARAADLQARIDAKGDYAVFVVPGEQHLQAALESLHGDPDVRDGDRVRCADTHLELVRKDGTWTRE